MLAHVRGFATPARQKLLAEASVIIGCSGCHSLLKSDAQVLQNQVAFISGSSKTVEFSDYLDGGFFWKTQLSDEVDTATDGRVLLVNRGEPLNFVYGSLSPELGDFQFANIIAGIDHLLTDSSVAGLHELSSERQRRVAEDWLTIYMSD